MTVRAVTEPTLRALLSQLQSRGRDRRNVVAVASEPRWSGEEVLTSDIGPARIMPCVSPLAVRTAIVEHTGDDETLVLLTDVDERSLGEEVLGRIWEGRVHQPTSWLALQQLAKVDRLDPKLAGLRWLVELLVNVAPSRGYPPPTGGMLTLDGAWRLAYRHALALPVEQPRLADLVTWAQTDTARRAVSAQSTTDRDAIARHLVDTVSPAASHLIGLVADGRGAEAISYGLVADVLWRDESDVRLAYPRAELATGLGHGKLDGAAARAWGAAAVAATREAARSDDAPVASGWTAKAEQLLSELDATPAAGASAVLPRGFELRLEQAGFALRAVIDQPDRALLEPLESARTAVRDHLAAEEGSGQNRTAALDAAVRLARRLVLAPEPPGSDLAALAGWYEQDGGWVDAARDATQAETVPVLADAYAALLAVVDEQRHHRDRSFAEAFAAWSTLPQGSDGPLLPIEDVLARVVAPIAASAPVLVLVVDGLSHAASHPVLRDLARRGWQRMAPADQGLPSVVAVAPSITRVSRASLLAGTLTEGEQQVERDGFAAHQALRGASKGRPPRLFHRSDLGDVAGRAAPAVQEALLDPTQRVVGIVVNGADDHLAKGGQLRLVDGLSGIRPLGPIEQTASEAGRVIVLIADHGHVVEHGTTYSNNGGDGGERWRSNHGAPADGTDEIELHGPRVLKGDGHLIAAATERLRYVKADKRGYHGGATPAEVLCPLAVLTPAGVRIDRWEATTVQPPVWWEPLHDEVDLDQLAALSQTRAAIADADAGPPQDEHGRLLLFPTSGAGPASAEVTDTERPAWLTQLLANPLLHQQRAMAGRASLDDAELAGLVGLLVGAGGTLPTAALASHLGLSPLRLRGKLDALRRLLNLDGYEVVALHSDGTVVLNTELLGSQFGVVIG